MGMSKVRHESVVSVLQVLSKCNTYIFCDVIDCEVLQCRDLDVFLPER